MIEFGTTLCDRHPEAVEKIPLTVRKYTHGQPTGQYETMYICPRCYPETFAHMLGPVCGRWCLHPGCTEPAGMISDTVPDIYCARHAAEFNRRWRQAAREDMRERERHELPNAGLGWPYLVGTLALLVFCGVWWAGWCVAAAIGGIGRLIRGLAGNERANAGFIRYACWPLLAGAALSLVLRRIGW